MSEYNISLVFQGTNSNLGSTGLDFSQTRVTNLRFWVDL